MLTAILYLVIGLILLSAGGWYLVKGASSLAILARVSLTVIGLTVVAMGTSLPELAVSVGAAAAGAPDMAYGNIVGSNILNIAVVLAAAGLISSIPVYRQIFRVEYPFMVAVTCLVMFLAVDGIFDRLEGAGLLTLLILFVTYMVKSSREIVPADEEGEFDGVSAMAQDGVTGPLPLGKSLIFVALGLIGLPLGAELMVRGAVIVAELYHVSERILGLTILAMGTSLPEVATTIVAAYRKEHDLVVANIIGSNIFNLLGILGVTSLVAPVPVNERAAAFDNWVMLGFAVVLFPVLWTRRKVSRRDGVVLLALFAVYMWFLLAR